ncbi:MAG: PIN domain-containing protein [Opitutaceae bacterium]|nr:PIN domain-containing protein [Opitutaceae bacterium]
MEYADTSFLLSLYLPDANHAAAVGYTRGWKRPPRLPLTPFGAFELNNSLRRLLHKGRLQSTDLVAVAGLVRADVANEVLEDCPLEAWRWIDTGNQISRRVTPQPGTRALDILHLAQAQIRGATTFLSFDRNQRQAAALAGLTVAP